jgi:CheY-like chemotaxis protein
VKKVLVVDDDKDVREIIHFILGDEGYPVEELGDGHFIHPGDLQGAERPPGDHRDTRNYCLRHACTNRDA